MNWFKQRKVRKETAARLYEVAAVQSRDPIFYERLGVADTIDGRFDLLSLCIFLMMDRLHQLGPDGHKLAQALFDRMFKSIDLTLREMGIGDLGVPKHMKKMMKAFNGRAHSYSEALAARNGDVLMMSIIRNVYRAEGEAVPQGAAALTEYVIEVHEMFQTFTMETFMSDAFLLPPVMRPRQEVAFG